MCIRDSPETELIEEKNLEPSFSEKYGVDYPEREVPVITFSEEYIKNFSKKLYKYRTDKSSLSGQAIQEIEVAMKFFDIS